MINLAIQLLWLLVGILCFVGVVWLVLFGIKQFIFPIPDKVEKGVWFIVLLLVIIAVLTMLAGGGTMWPFHRLADLASGAAAA